ncbi:MAG: glycine radical domain-containing protein [[Clostridium] scindens]
MDHLQTGGTLLNQKFTPSVVAGEEGLNQMANLVRTYFNMDGHHIQFNVIDKETLIQAQKHPEDYKDLIVRVAGYSDHFRNLSKALQDEIIGKEPSSSFRSDTPVFDFAHPFAKLTRGTFYFDT